MRCYVRLAFFLVLAMESIRLGFPLTVNNPYKEKWLNATDESKTTWQCRDVTVNAVPSNLSVKTKEMRLDIKYAGIEVLDDQSLAPYANVLTELILTFVPKFHTLGPSVFNDTKKLEMIYISHAKNLTHIHENVFKVSLPNLNSLRIIQCGLQTVPYLGKLITDHRIAIVDFDANKIREIDTACVNITVNQLYLSFNEIQSVKSRAFEGSDIKELFLMGNEKLTVIDADAFLGTKLKKILDLSNTSITSLPTGGLEELEELRIRHTSTFKKFPSVYDLKNIVVANLTYPYHCCAFKYHEKHDPVGAEKWQKQQEKVKKFCDESPIKPRECDRKLFENLACDPKPDAFTPCEDIMGNWMLRIAVWFVAILAIFGNLAVLVVSVSKFSKKVPLFLMCNLATADLCMGIYLTMIAVTDARSIGVYFNEAIGWQSGLGCQAAGILTVFSTELSVFTLTIMAIERYYTIKHAMHRRRLKLRTVAVTMAVGWIYAGVMAVLPLAGISGYAKTSLCLPLDEENIHDQAYLATILAFGCTSFSVILICYGNMYSAVKVGAGRKFASVARSDAKTARKMALLIFTDFACWAPVAFFGITALAERPLITVSATKYVLVFFYPLNSLVNPYLYAILTRQYREDALTLLADLNVCRARITRLRGSRNLTARSGRDSNGAGRSREKNYPLALTGNPNERSPPLDEQR